MYLAVDIGASSGRHILGWLEDGRLQLKEIYRFENGMTEQEGSFVWDVEHLVAEIVNGLKACKAEGVCPKSVAIDTWGVDYALLDAEGNLLSPVYAYRDSRTEGAAEEIDALIPREELYRRTGIQKQNYNTIYQLWCDKKSGKLPKAAHCLMMPEYLAYRLTGQMANEYTIASTSGLLNAESRQWDGELLRLLGLPEGLFLPLSQPGTALGALSEEIANEVGFQTTVTLAAGHDTASAVAACPLDDGSVYISSGTWSLIGTENRAPVTTEAARLGDFTNEGGVGGRIRFLENIMGMWLFQSIRRNIGKTLTYDEMMEAAMNSTYQKLVDPNDSAFLAPADMLAAVRERLGEPELPLGDVLNSVYHSLATSYDRAVKEIETISGKEIHRILIVGGGSKDSYLNRLTARITGKTVCTGLGEATATGNILTQIMCAEGLSLEEARDIVRNTVEWTEVTA